MSGFESSFNTGCPVVNVLIVEDSAVCREYLRAILGSDPSIRVMGVVTNGVEAIEFLRRQKPDVITMDIHMPKMDGIEATRQIMESNPVPIVIVSSSVAHDEVGMSFKAMAAGAVAVIEKPHGVGHADSSAATARLLQTVKSMSEVKVVRRWRPGTAKAGSAAPPTGVGRIGVEPRLVVIGASTGGPPVLFTILSQLPADFRLPIVIVQHIAPGFVDGLAEWLDRGSPLTVRVAKDGEKLSPHHAYLAPDGFHTGVDPYGRIVLSDAGPENGLRPAVSYLFRSAAASYQSAAVGVLLTGMGQDGAEDLRLMQNAGAVTVAQDHGSSVVHGMPGEAIRIGAAAHILPPEGVATLLRRLAKPSDAGESPTKARSVQQ